MAKLVIDAAMDAALNHVKGKEGTPGLTLTVNDTDPANRTAAVSGGANHLASVALDTGGADLTIANGATDGRQLTVAEKADIPVDVSGTATRVCIVDDTNILLKTENTGVALDSAGTVTVQTWSWTIRDAT